MIFRVILIQPIYNVFIYLIGITGGGVGLAIIALTVLMRIIFYPAFASSIRTQMGMQAVQAELDEINKKYKDNPDERAKRTMALFKENNVRPLSGFVALIVQIPVFIALYWAFFREGLPKIATDLLYPAIHAPAQVSTSFFGINLLTPHNIVLALLVGVLQYLVTRFTVARTNRTAKRPTDADKAAAQKMQQQMMLYFLPALMAMVSFSLPAAVGLYFTTTNVFSLGQEWLIRRQGVKKG